jgi:hypothetical protein
MAASEGLGLFDQAGENAGASFVSTTRLGIKPVVSSIWPRGLVTTLVDPIV